MKKEGRARAAQAAGVSDQAVPTSAAAARVSGGTAGAAVGRSKGPRRCHCPRPRSNDPRHCRARAPEPRAPGSLYDSALPPLPSPPTEAAASRPRSPSANHRRPVANSIAAERAKHAGDSFAAVAMAPIAKELARLVDDVKGPSRTRRGSARGRRLAVDAPRGRGVAGAAAARPRRDDRTKAARRARRSNEGRDGGGALRIVQGVSTTNPGGEPRNAEAKRQLLFFANSLHNRRLAPPPPVAQMRTWSAFTPHYAEDVTYSTARAPRIVR